MRRVGKQLWRVRVEWPWVKDRQAFAYERLLITAPSASAAALIGERVARREYVENGPKFQITKVHLFGTIDA